MVNQHNQYEQKKLLERGHDTPIEAICSETKALWGLLPEKVRALGVARKAKPRVGYPRQSIPEAVMECEPTFIRQCKESKSNEARDEWFRTQAIEAKKAGCTYCRLTIHPDNINRVMVEGWATRPRRTLPQRWNVTVRDPAPSAAA